MEVQKGLIYQKISAVMADIDAISKSRTNVQQGFKFRGIDDVYNELHDILAKHKIFTVPTIKNRQYRERQTAKGGMMMERILTIQYRFYAEDGSYVDAEVDGEAMDMGDKATNKCMAIAHKYCLFQVFCIPTEDSKDPDEATPPPLRAPTYQAPARPVQKPETRPMNPPIPPTRAGSQPPVGVGFAVPNNKNQAMQAAISAAQHGKDEIPEWVK